MKARFQKWRDRRKIQKKVRKLERGRLPCSNCRKHANLNELTSFQSAACPKCGTYNFVPQRVDRFWLLELLGRGGMGRVYKSAPYDQPRKLSAVKLLPEQKRNNAELLQSLFREAELAENCGDHPSLVKCVAKGYDGDEPFYAMEYIDGEPLGKRVERCGPLPVKEICNMALDLISAEQRIYSHGFLYRDLSPDNVVFNRKNRAILFDYGLCLPLEEAHNPTEDTMNGSPYYIPPERWLAHAEDAYSEIYSLGLIMYFAVAGRNFIHSRDLPHAAQRHVSYLRIPVKSKLRGFPNDVVEVLTNMIEQDTSKRYQTFEEAAKAIKELRKRHK